jgi:aryl-alcohol dehydrogenase-like predicted oxidoreductase
MTKCGRYGLSDFDYSPARIRSSVENSLKRLRTDYLDTVYLHDVEFVCTLVAPRKSGNHLAALADDKVQYGLAEGDEGKIRGDGDQKVLDAFAELRKLKGEGKVKHIGITGRLHPNFHDGLLMKLGRISSSYASSFSTVDSSYPTIQVGRRAHVLLPSFTPERHFLPICARFPRAS